MLTLCVCRCGEVTDDVVVGCPLQIHDTCRHLHVALSRVLVACCQGVIPVSQEHQVVPGTMKVVNG